ncbi:MAG TPA: TIGR04013 family B12-binding domain/radical SAM domain-containing protein, partial [Minicystis sp.]|nr:TIGR04013 family B12-binding domain/radical SAM domain-containing protein [Minicystis sp.]
DAARAVVGWSFYSTDFPRAAAELARARALAGEADRAALHVAGGVHATAEPLDVLRAGFDLAAIGEGETTIVTLFETLARRGDPRALRGLAHLDAAGRLVSHGPGARRELDAFPAFNVRHGKWNPIEITRGCVFACAFCQTPFAFKARFRHRSVENVRAHVEAMKEDGVRYVRFVSPTALSYGAEDDGVNLPAVEALLAAVREAIGREGKIYFGTFPSELRPEHVTPAALAVLARWVDNTRLVIGAQSGSERVLAAMRRGHGVEDVERAVRAAREVGFGVDVDLLLATPGETAEDRRATLALAERLVASGATIRSHAFLPLPGTPWRDAAPEAIEPDVAARIGGLEAASKVRGPWRTQVLAAADLVRRRRASADRA